MDLLALTQAAMLAVASHYMALAPYARPPEHRMHKIGLFDSGVGGLTLLKHVRQALPEHDMVYFGDTARTPYGTRSNDAITFFSEQAVNFLFDQDVSLIIVACNSACAVALPTLQRKYASRSQTDPRRIVGIVVPTAEEIVRLVPNGLVGLIGTSATVASKAYDQEIAKLGNGVSLTSLACPLLVPLVEEGWEGTPVADLVCKTYLERLPVHEMRALAFGCTHYPFLADDFRRLLPERVSIIEQGPVVARRTVEYLKKHQEIDRLLSRSGKTEYYCSGEVESFCRVGGRFFGSPIHNVQRVTELPRPKHEQHRALGVVPAEQFIQSDIN
jgi:glutamate racemase